MTRVSRRAGGSLLFFASVAMATLGSAPCHSPDLARGMSFSDATLQAAILADHSYREPPNVGLPYVPNSGPPPEQYKFVDSEPDEANYPSRTFGFAATAYRNPVTNEIIIAFRGTEPTDPLDLSADAGIAAEVAGPGPSLGLIGPGAATALTLEAGRAVLLDQLAAAKAFTERVEGLAEGRPISFSGHSLGGGIAQYEAARTGYPAHTFNAPGMEQSIDRRLDPAHQGDKVFNHARTVDPVHYIGERHGQTLDYERAGKLGLALTQHSIEELVVDLKNGMAPKEGWPSPCPPSGVPVPPPTTGTSPEATAPTATPRPSPAKSPGGKSIPGVAPVVPTKPCPKGVFTLCGAIPTKTPKTP